jgi:hypothetical protein
MMQKRPKLKIDDAEKEWQRIKDCFPKNLSSEERKEIEIRFFMRALALKRGTN